MVGYWDFGGWAQNLASLMEQKLTGSQKEKVELELELERFHMTRGGG
jgi:hypothetical protein